MGVSGQRDFTEDSKSPKSPGRKNNINTDMRGWKDAVDLGISSGSSVLTECSSAEWNRVTKENSSSEPVRRLLSTEEDSRRC